MFDDLIVPDNKPKNVVPKKKMTPVDQSSKASKEYGGINEDEEYSWSVRILRDGASIIEIVTTDNLSNIDDGLMKDVVKKLRRL